MKHAETKRASSLQKRYDDLMREHAELKAKRKKKEETHKNKNKAKVLLPVAVVTRTPLPTTTMVATLVVAAEVVAAVEAEEATSRQMQVDIAAVPLADQARKASTIPKLATFSWSLIQAKVSSREIGKTCATQYQPLQGTLKRRSGLCSNYSRKRTRSSKKRKAWTRCGRNFVSC